MKKLLLLFVTLLTSSLFFGKAYAEPITVSSNDFTVSIDNIQFYDFDFNIQPADHIYKYIVGIRSQEMLDEYENGGTDDEIFGFELDYYTMIGEWYSKTWQEAILICAMEGQLEGTCTEWLGTLDYGKHYIFYVYGINEDGEFATPLTRLEFDTPKSDPVDMTFDVNFESVTEDTFSATVTPSLDDQPYFLDIQNVNFTDWYIENNELELMMEKLVAASLPKSAFPGKWIDAGAYTIPENEYTFRRKDLAYKLIVFGFDQSPTTEPYFFVIQMNDSGVMEVIDSKTLAQDPVFSIDGKKVSDTSDRAALSRLDKGIYIINGKKIVLP